MNIVRVCVCSRFYYIESNFFIENPQEQLIQVILIGIHSIETNRQGNLAPKKKPNEENISCGFECQSIAVNIYSFSFI